MDRVSTLEQEIGDLRRLLLKKENELCEIKEQTNVLADKLSNDEIARYSRQVILPELGVKGQLKLRNSAVLVVGAGGLGCPASLYLASAGLGHIGIVDYDFVEINNLHRQSLHTEASLGTPKTESAKNALQKINSNMTIVTYNMQLTSVDALEVIREYDVIVDCTDNVATRYLLNDACALSDKPLVSGSALQMEGQLTVYNHKMGPCYRCIFPTPPPPETVTNCGDGGVLGAVTGVIGSLQALETIKVLLDLDDVLSGRLLLFDGAKSTFRNVKLRAKRPNCDVCSDQPIITRLIDYEQFCGMRASDKDFSLNLLEEHERISAIEYKMIVESKSPHVLIDVRSPNEFEICHLENSRNIPIKDILEDKQLDLITEMIKSESLPVYLLCRRGNDSQLAVKHLQVKLKGITYPKDIRGGLYAWHDTVDKSFPIY